MNEDTSGTRSAEVLELSLSNLYLPHKWFSSSALNWLYAIKKQPRIGTWTFIHEGDDVRIFESEAARDAEIVRLQQLEQAAATARHNE